MTFFHSALSTNSLDLCRDMSVNSWQIELCLKAFKRTLHEQMFSLSDDGGVSSIPLSYEARKYLLVWWAFLKENINVYPIAEELCSPPLQYKTITTDAAGWNLSSREGQIGMRCVGLDEEGVIFMATQWFWSDELSRNFQDSKKKLLGCKTMTLEFAGILCPFLTHPEVQANQNRGHPGCHYAWENSYSIRQHQFW